MELTSVNNEKVKTWAKYKVKKYREEDKCFLIEGDHLVNIALEKGLVKELICLDDIYSFDNKYIVTKEIMEKISSQKTISSVAAVVPFITEELDSDSNIIVLDNLQDPGNLGTIIRSCAAFGFKSIVLGNGTVDIYNDKVVRASEGMIFNISFIKLDLENELDILRNLGYKIIGTDVTKGKSVKNVDGKLAIVIGNEGSGMNKSIICDEYINIKMESTCESLNAGVCASIIMHEVYND